MHELTRLAYLEAMGVDNYVSRRALRGAAPTRRLAVSRDRVLSAAGGSQMEGVPPQAPPDASQSPLPRDILDSNSAPASTRATPVATRGRAPAPERFSLAAVVAGGLLWLEDLAGMPLSKEQVWLMGAMAQAVGISAARRRGNETGALRTDKPDVAQFDWPIHTNDQFDLGADAARASVAGFVSPAPGPIPVSWPVLLGEACEHRVQVQEPGVTVVRTLSTAHMLAEPASKARVWRDLAPLLHH